MGDSYRPDDGGGRPRYNDYGRRAPSPDRGRRNDGFTFRGTAGTSDRYRPQEQFTFEAPTGPRGPHFPPAQPPPRDVPQRPRNRADARTQASRGGRPQRGGHAGGFKKFRPKPAHQRDLLKPTDREPTPEQLHGMYGEGDHHYVEYISSDDETGKPDSDEAGDHDARSRKRIKADDAATTGTDTALPRWSNPDPYSVLPPTDLGIGPKKDIVQTIRKAKVETAAQSVSTNAIKENADFISFDFGEDDNEEDPEAEEEFDIDAPPPPPPADLLMPTPDELRQAYDPASTGRKRKRESDLGVMNDIVTEWQPNETNPTPWLRADAGFTSHVGLQLHKEIIDFYDYVRPYPHEADIRNEIIARIESAIVTFGPRTRDAKVESFGSFAAGLYLPTADMDLVAISRAFERNGAKELCQSNSAMHKMSRHLANCGISKPGSMTVIGRAKVPIIKFVDKLTGIKVDISFENDSGLYANRTFRDWKDKFPEMPVLVTLIKQFLAMRGLNEVFNGGIGGFTIICLVVHMLQHLPERQVLSGDWQSRHGELLLHFLDLYGNKFDLRETGIFMEPPGTFSKTHDSVSAKVNANGLTIIDPNRANNDISGGSRRVAEVFASFRRARNAVQKRLNQIRTGHSTSKSILECILGGNYTSFQVQRDTLDRLDRNRPRQSSPSAYGRGSSHGESYDHQRYPTGSYQYPQHPTTLQAPPQALHYQSYPRQPPPLQHDYHPRYNDYPPPQQYPSEREPHPRLYQLPASYPPPTHALPTRPPPGAGAPGHSVTEVAPISKKARKKAKKSAPAQPLDTEKTPENGTMTKQQRRKEKTKERKEKKTKEMKAERRGETEEKKKKKKLDAAKQQQQGAAAKKTKKKAKKQKAPKQPQMSPLPAGPSRHTRSGQPFAGHL